GFNGPSSPSLAGSALGTAPREPGSSTIGSCDRTGAPGTVCKRFARATRTGSTFVGALSKLCTISVKAVRAAAISSVSPEDNGAPHWEHSVAQTTLIASHREHRVRFSGDRHSLQNVD